MSGQQGGWYPQEPYYAPGWTAPAGPPPERRRPSRALLWVLVGLLVAAAVAALVGLWLQHRATRTLGEVTGPTSANARQLAVGHCLGELGPDGTVGRVVVVPCAEPHAAEVVGVHEIRADEWPGARSVEREAAAACEMDSAQADAGARPVVWTPSEDGWAEGDRSAVCLAWTPDGDLTGSWTAGDVDTGEG